MCLVEKESKEMTRACLGVWAHFSSSLMLLFGVNTQASLEEIYEPRMDARSGVLTPFSTENK